MGVASGCGEQEAGVANGSGWNQWVWLVGVVVRRYRFPHTTYRAQHCRRSGGLHTAAALLAQGR